VKKYPPIREHTAAELETWRLVVSASWGLWEVACLTGRSVETVRRMCVARKIPHSRMIDNGAYRFKPAEVIRWFENRQRRAAS
jgi:predicted DNA-binding transcriptional regulator AlpA